MLLLLVLGLQSSCAANTVAPPEVRTLWKGALVQWRPPSRVKWAKGWLALDGAPPSVWMEECAGLEMMCLHMWHTRAHALVSRVLPDRELAGEACRREQEPCHTLELSCAPSGTVLCLS